VNQRLIRHNYLSPRSVSEKQEHAPSRPASPAKNKHNSKIAARLARLLGARSALFGRAPSRTSASEDWRTILDATVAAWWKASLSTLNPVVGLLIVAATTVSATQKRS
jgi:hypothetical protein